MASQEPVNAAPRDHSVIKSTSLSILSIISPTQDKEGHVAFDNLLSFSFYSGSKAPHWTQLEFHYRHAIKEGKSSVSLTQLRYQRDKVLSD